MKFKTFYKLFYKHRFKKSSLVLRFYLFIVLPIRFLLNIFFFPKKIDLDLLENKFPNLYKKNINFLFEYFNSDKGEFFVDQYSQPIKVNNQKYQRMDIQNSMKNFFSIKKKKIVIS